MRLYLSGLCPHVWPWGSNPWRRALTTLPPLLHNSSLLVGSSHRCLRRTHTWMHWLSFTPKRLQASRAVWRVVQRGVGLCVARHRTGLLLGAVCLAQKYEFEVNGITEAALERCREENQVGGIKALLEATVTCPVCGKRQVLHDKVPGVDYCECREGNTVQWDRSYEGWMPFLEQHNILVWRKPHHHWPHLYAYKVYGRYDDVSLCAFAETQLSATYRTEWDPSALDLRVLETDEAIREQRPALDSDTYSAQDLLYWLVKFPSFFANRDYVFKRRYRCDGPRQEVVIVSEAASEDSGVAPVAGVHRVHYYWSVMVLKARHRDFTKPGIEYVLSYFDNPGTSLPAPITNFIASTAFPNFLQRLHGASLELQRKHEAGELVYRSLPRAILGTAALQPTHQLQPLHDKGAVEVVKPGPVESSAITEVMEALGDIAPSQEEKVLVLKKIDQLLNDALDKLDDNNPLIAKIKFIKRRIDYYRMHNKMKKETAVTAEGLDDRDNRYEDVLSPPVLVQQLFETMSQVLKADHDMRTGRGLLDADQWATDAGGGGSDVAANTEDAQLCAPCCSADGEHSSHCPMDTDTESSDRSHNTESQSQSSWSSWLYNVFIEKTISLVRSPSKSTEAACEDNESDEIESQVPNTQKPETESENADIQCCDPSVERQSRLSESRLWYYVYGWLWWPTVSSESITTATTASVPCSEGRPEGTDTDQLDHSWYWSPVIATRRGGAWLYSYLTNTKL